MIFECSLTKMQLAALRQRLLDIASEREEGLRIYGLLTMRQRYLWPNSVTHEIDMKCPLVV